MNIYAIGDLHLSGAANKPMDVFGDAWRNHGARIQQAWTHTVGEEDVVLLPGDFSWAMRREEAAVDFAFLHALPGKKVMIRGNHDYWWSSLTQVRAMLPKSVQVIQNDSVSFGTLHICGTRGWNFPGAASTQEDKKIYDRELQRLSLSIKALPAGGTSIAMLHFPPLNDRWEDTGFSLQLHEAGIRTVVYGHLHARACRGGFEGSRNGIVYHLVSADHIGFAPKLIMQL